mmetsp:Transcript_7878/g.15760  ORF Transcript_7878/g.15760 Transcript_7878/m.15760 type:complete len:271 (-) Transcript_7878:151-963(-)
MSGSFSSCSRRRAILMRTEGCVEEGTLRKTLARLTWWWRRVDKTLVNSSSSFIPPSTSADATSQSIPLFERTSPSTSLTSFHFKPNSQPLKYLGETLERNSAVVSGLFRHSFHSAFFISSPPSSFRRLMASLTGSHKATPSLCPPSRDETALRRGAGEGTLKCRYIIDVHFATTQVRSAPISTSPFTIDSNIEAAALLGTISPPPPTTVDENVCPSLNLWDEGTAWDVVRRNDIKPKFRGITLSMEGNSVISYSDDGHRLPENVVGANTE